MKETSRLFKPYFLITFIPVIGILLFLLITGYQKNDSVAVFLSAFFITINVFLLVILNRFRLTLKINEEGIRYKYAPFHKQEQYLEWGEIKQAYVYSFNPLSEFKGWGRKYSNRYGRGYLTQGKWGLHITDSHDNSFTLTVLDHAKTKELISLYKGD